MDEKTSQQQNREDRSNRTRSELIKCIDKRTGPSKLPNIRPKTHMQCSVTAKPEANNVINADPNSK